MITQIDMRNTPAFGSTISSIDDLRTFNFFFGANGTGKTTISKIIADCKQFPECSVSWANGIALETRVYNRDFVERNFTLQSPLKGVFTLGEEEADTITKIETAKNEIDALMGDIKNLTTTLHGNDGNGGKKQELSKFETTYAERFWSAKQKHAAKLAGGLKGFIGSKDNFKNKVLIESTSNGSDLLQLDTLETRAAMVFSEILENVQSISPIQPQKLLSLEHAPILGKRVIGKEDVDLAAIIKKLGNSDWVRQGIFYYEANNGVCPFCQQKTDESFTKSLSEYFDETFEQDNAAINALVSDYSTESGRIQEQVQAIIDLRSNFIDGNKLENEKRALDAIITMNVQRLSQKEKEASQVIELDSLQNVLNAIAALIATANEKIDANNTIVHNIANERKTLIKQIWRFIVEELKNNITEYKNKKANLSAAIKNIENQLCIKNNEKSAKEIELRGLEKKIVSIQPTLDGINELLTLFGFKNFKLSKGNDGKSYKLVRANGSDAQNTLSEGEQNFIAFLYFYYLLKGSQDESGMTSDKIVVFDDPVSSLDNDVLFIVSSLIRELFDDVRQNKGPLKQIFVLTHNLYFHKEITYNSKRKKGLLKEESFWLIKKQEVDSIIKRQTANPIKTSYDLLWEEVRSEQRNNTTIQNTLRRILENYFKLLGSIPLDELYKRFDGVDKIKCKALCSWVNDGSHSAFDNDFYTPLDDTTVQKFLEVFKQIFQKMGHIAHYNMMMGINPETANKEELAS